MWFREGLQMEVDTTTSRVVMLPLESSVGQKIKEKL